MRLAFIGSVFTIALGVFIAMLVGVWRHRSRVPTTAKVHAVLSEYVWISIPWIILAICAAPAVHEVLAAG